LKIGENVVRVWKASDENILLESNSYQAKDGEKSLLTVEKFCSKIKANP
jgi:hypothetical protein